MVTYDVIISPLAAEQLTECIDYLRYEKANDQAAKSVYHDALNTAETLKTVAGSLRLCDNPRLYKLGYHKINFLHHDYVMFYKIIGTAVHINGIYHQLQDYEKLFLNVLKQ